MLLRRLMTHVRDQNWFAVALDFAIVVLGVFFGFQLTAWNEAQHTRRTADAYHERLLTDLRAEQALFHRHIAYYSVVESHAVRMATALEGPPEALGAAFLVDAYQATQVLSYAPIRGTYEELLAVGAIDTLPDVALRGRLDAYYRASASRAVEWALRATYRDVVRAYLPDPVQRAIHEACEDLLPGAATLDEACDPDLAPDEVEAALARLLSAPDLWVHANRNRADLRVKLLLFRAQLEAVDEMIAYLEETAP